MVITGARLMPKFTLIAEHVDLYTGKSNGHKLTYEFEVDHISHVLENVDFFIRGAGYNPEGTLDYVPDEDYYGTGSGPEWQTPEWETPQFVGDGHDGMGSTMADYPELYDEQDLPQGKSKHYFDTERNK